MRRWVLLMAFAMGLLTLSADAAPRLTTDKPSYALGERVVFTLRNDTAQPMMWASISYYPVVSRVFAGGKEEVVRELPRIVLLALGQLDQGESGSWKWDQRDYHQWYDDKNPPVEGKQVPAGVYRARFEALTHGELATPTFTIGDILSVNPRRKLATTWARLRASR